MEFSFKLLKGVLRNPAHQGLILRMNDHFLIEMTDMFHWICSAIVNGERGLMKSPRKTRAFYISHERWLRNLTQRLVHGIIPYAFMGRALIPAPMVIFLITGESLTGRSSGSSSICSIICLLRRQLEIGRWMPSLCAAQFLLQLINFTLHVPFILCMGNMAFPSRLTFTSMHCVHTPLVISPLLKVYKRIVMLRTPRFYLVQISILLMWTHRWLV